MIELFDSVYRGFPIGELLLSKRSGDAASLAFGPIRVSAPAMPEAYFVVDGQQRITALAGSLLHPDSPPRGDVHAVWFDLERRTFERLRGSTPPPSWIPLNVVADSLALLSWLDDWPFRKERRDLAERAIELGKAIREYQILAYIVEATDDDVLRLIFKRVNTSGVAMKEAEVFEALSGARTPRPIESACSRLESETAFGRIDAEVFVRCLKVVEGLDLRTNFSTSEDAAKNVAAEGIERTEIALRRTMTFLSEDANIPHRDLLPYRLPLAILSSFFRFHPDPEPRLRLLLTRWVWRGILSREHQKSSDADVSTLRGLIDSDAYGSVERLLATVPVISASMPDADAKWNGRHAEIRAAAVAMLAMQPKDPVTLLVIGADRVRELFAAKKQLGSIIIDVERSGVESSVARRVLLPERLKIRRLLEAPGWVLQSHGINECARVALDRGDFEAFARERSIILNEWFCRFFTEKAGVGESDRPTIAEIIKRVDETLGAA